jgi:hypothetical protein
MTIRLPTIGHGPRAGGSLALALLASAPAYAWQDKTPEAGAQVFESAFFAGYNPITDLRSLTVMIAGVSVRLRETSS